MRKLFLIILVLTTVGVSAQIKPYGFAGDDISVYFDPNGSYPRTEVGVDRVVPGDGNEPNPQYYWNCTSKPSDEAFCFIMDAHEPITEILLTKPGTYIMELTRVSEFGIQRESVTVTVTNDVELISATPKKNCYMNGTTMKVSDFKLVTQPQLPEDKYEDKIRMYPRTETLEVGNKLEDMFYYQEVFFDVGNDDNEGNQIWKKSPIPAKVMATSDFKFKVVLDDGGWWTLFDCGLFGEEAVEKVQTMKTILELYENLKKIPKYIRSNLPPQLAEPKPHPGADLVKPYKVEFDPKPSEIFKSVGVYLTDECCDDNKTVRIGLTGSVLFGAKAELEIPVPGLNVPGAGGLTILGGAGLQTGADIDLSVPIGCPSDIDLKVLFKANLSLSVGLSAFIVSPKVASINIVESGEISPQVEWSPSSGYGPFEMDGNLHINIYVMGVGIKVANVDFPIYPVGEPQVTFFEMPEDIDDVDDDDDDNGGGNGGGGNGGGNGSGNGGGNGGGNNGGGDNGGGDNGGGDNGGGDNGGGNGGGN